MMSITSDRLREHFNHDVTESAANEIEALEKSECGAWKTVAKLRFALAETEALEISHGERIEKLTAERDALKQQRDELLAAAEAIEIAAEECLDFDECTAMLVPIDAYHKLMEAIASVKEK